MRKILILTILVLLTAIIITGCAGEKNINQNDATPAATTPASETPPSKNPESATTADAYYLIFKDLFEKDAGLNGGIEYLALDLSAVKAAETDRIIELFETFSSNNELTLLLDTYDGLTEKGYIKNMYFDKGLLISFKDQSLTETELVTDASKWRSGDGADGATYTAVLKDGEWGISEISGEWIS